MHEGEVAQLALAVGVETLEPLEVGIGAVYLEGVVGEEGQEGFVVDLPVCG